jgi:hypothetical protein
MHQGVTFGLVFAFGFALVSLQIATAGNIFRGESTIKLGIKKKLAEGLKKGFVRAPYIAGRFIKVEGSVRFLDGVKNCTDSVHKFFVML